MVSGNVLIIENDDDIFDIITFLLVDNGLVVYRTTIDALFDDLSFFRPKLLILDHIQVAEERDLALCRRIHSQSEIFKPPIILISSSFQIDAFAQSCKATAYISKPFDINDFIDVVNEVLYPATENSE
ncbi:MAG TPA: response regulator [Pedobacter sp.]|jgi:DNA-binding response OmpR family regulator